MSIILLAAWLGGSLLTAAVVAPAAFAVLPSRTLAGAMVGRVLPVLFFSGAAIGAIVALLASRDRRSRASSATVAPAAIVMALGCLVAQLGIAPRIERIRREIGGPIDALAPADARRIAFGRLHGASVLALGVSMIGGTLALVGGARSLVRRTRQPGEGGDL